MEPVQRRLRRSGYRTQRIVKAGGVFPQTVRPRVIDEKYVGRSF